MNNPKFSFVVVLLSLQMIIFVFSSSVIPHRYWLELNPNLEVDNFIFNGYVRIDFSLENNIGIISLRSKNLSIIENKTYLETTYIWGWRRVSVKHEYTEDNLILKINETLTGSSYYRLSLYYIGALNNKNIGFYRTSYRDSNNKTRWIAATNFQPNYPHYAFPCFSDNPETKAPFQISLRRTKNQTVWSSTSPLYRDTSSGSSDDKILRSYDWSPNLSPNELVFVIGEHPNATCPVWTAPDVPS